MRVSRKTSYDGHAKKGESKRLSQNLALRSKSPPTFQVSNLKLLQYLLFECTEILAIVYRPIGQIILILGELSLFG